jgi:multiple sugar transport system substrate-binding protein
LSLASGLLATGALAACRGGTRQVGGATPLARSRTTLTEWYHAYGESGTEQAVRRYARSYDPAQITVQWTSGDYATRLATALSGDNGPDVFEAANGPTIDQIRAGQVLPIQGVLGAAAADFNKLLLERMTYRGKLYAVPQVMDVQLLVYRRSMLAKAGVKPPSTFDELVAAAARLTSKRTKGLFVGNDGGVAVLTGPALWSIGADYLTAAGRPAFDTAQAAVAFARLRDLFTSGSLLLDSPAAWSDPAPFTGGLTAMQWTGLWTFPALQESLGDDFGVLPWPRFDARTGRPSVPIGAYGAAVNAKSKNPDVAKAYLKWLWVDQTDKQVDFAQSYGFHIPARASLSQQTEKLKTGAAAAAATLATRYGRPQTPLLWTPASNQALADAVSSIVGIGREPTAALRHAKTVANAELKRIGA